jgi:CheY-like chemotaxis protein
MDEREKANILLVDDQPAKLLTYEAILRDLDANLIKATSAHEAFNYLLKNDVAVILIDVFMPELDGYQLASMVREHPRFQQTPIIFISAIALSELDRLRGYESGAVDYVPVPVVPEILRAKVRIFVELFKKTRDLERLNRELEDRVIERTAALEASNEQLKESEQRLRLASEAAEFGTYDYNPAAGYFECSPLMKQLFGLDNKSEVTPDTFLQCVYEPDRAMVRRSIFAPERNEDNRHRIEFRVSHAEGFRWLLDCGRAFFSDGQDGHCSRHNRAQASRRASTSADCGTRSPREKHPRQYRCDRQTVEPQHWKRQRLRGSARRAHSSGSQSAQCPETR